MVGWRTIPAQVAQLEVVLWRDNHVGDPVDPSMSRRAHHHTRGMVSIDHGFMGKLQAKVKFNSSHPRNPLAKEIAPRGADG